MKRNEVTLAMLAKMYQRAVVYPLAGLVFGTLFFIISTFAILIPLKLLEDGVNLFELYIAETILVGWVIVLMGEWHRGWKTKVFLMGTTTVLSIFNWIVIAKLLPF